MTDELQERSPEDILEERRSIITEMAVTPLFSKRADYLLKKLGANAEEYDWVTGTEPPDIDIYNT